MSPGRLLQYFDQVSEVPDAVPRLRRFILDLAVRGKLVEHDPTDEPASELLNRIETEKRRLLAEGEIKRQEPLPAVAADEMPFAVPSGWCVQRMGWLAKKLGAGSTPLGGKSVYQKEGVPFLRSQNVHDDGVRLDDVALISRSIHEEMSGTHVQPQDILLNITGASIGRCALVASSFREGNVSQHVAIIRLFLPDIRDFIHLSLISPTYQQLIRDVEVGVSREGLSMRRLRLFPMILPPLPEQHRIAGKVDELMALCDELEAAQAKREKRRDRLVAATLHGLNNGDASPEPGTHPTFEESARFYFNHLPRLTTRPEHIHQLRQTILNLAVRGKLVPEVSCDQTLAPKVYDAPFHLPVSWQWKAVADLGDTQTGSTPPTAERKHYGGSIPFIKPAAINDSVINYEEQGLTESGARESTHVEAGAILMVCIGGSIGKAAIVDRPVCFNQQINSVSPTEEAHPRFVLLAMRSPYFQERVLDTAAKGTLPIISKGKWERLSIPLPPIAEQHRIVVKVDELMALCDELEARLTTTATARRQLLEATLHDALGGES